MNKSPVIRLDEKDNVVVARVAINAGTVITSESVTALQDVPLGHKVATRLIKKGEPVLKYNTVIGFASEDLVPGTWLHSHNITFDDFQRDYAFSKNYRPVELVAPDARRTFQGYVREDGRVGTRNTLGVFVVGNCGATVARKIAHHFDERYLQAWPNVD